MFQSLKQLYGHKLSASDGPIGTVKDFCFDDRQWTVRYAVADTGTWLSGRHVLLSRLCVGTLDQPGATLKVQLTRAQIETSPAIGNQKPVSRQDEVDCHLHYGWPPYWDTDLPLATQPTDIDRPPQLVQTHLRRTRVVTGYQLHTEDGILGHVCDFIVDAETWTIQQIVVKTGHRLSGEEVMIQIANVERISDRESAVFAHLSGDAAKPLPPPVVPEETQYPHPP